jgi:hypothetical protein
MFHEYKTQEDWKMNMDLKNANRLKNLVLGRGDDGFLSSISEIFGNKLRGFVGENEKVVPTDDFVNYLVQANFARNRDEARKYVLPTMQDSTMRYKSSPEGTWSLRVNRVEDQEGKEAYRVSRFIG